jgi:hypothetical protein
VSGRPYQDHSQAELLEMKRQAERDYRSVDRELLQFQLRARSPASEEIEDLNGKLQRLSKLAANLEDELAARRAERAERRRVSERPREERSREGKGRARRSELVALHCACQPPRRIKVLAAVHRGGPIVCGLCQQPFQQ